MLPLLHSVLAKQGLAGTEGLDKQSRTMRFGHGHQLDGCRITAGAIAGRSDSLAHALKIFRNTHVSSLAFRRR